MGRRSEAVMAANESDDPMRGDGAHMNDENDAPSTSKRRITRDVAKVDYTEKEEEEVDDEDAYSDQDEGVDENVETTSTAPKKKKIGRPCFDPVNGPKVKRTQAQLDRQAEYYRMRTAMMAAGTWTPRGSNTTHASLTRKNRKPDVVVGGDGSVGRQRAGHKQQKTYHNRDKAHTSRDSSKEPKVKKPKEELTDEELQERQKIKMRRQDHKWLKDYNMHYPGKKYSLLSKVDADQILPLRNFVEEILARSHETEADWEKREQEYLEAGRKWEEECVVGTTAYDGEWDEIEEPREVMVLMKYKDFPAPYWVSYSTVENRAKGEEAIQWFRWREQALSKVRTQMREEYAGRGEDFDEHFPAVFLPDDNTEGYATSKAFKRQTLLRAREADINQLQSRNNSPWIVLADWTGQEEDKSNLMEFMWTNELTRSDKVEQIVQERLDDRISTRCGRDCSCIGGSKPCRCREHPDEEKTECGPTCACACQAVECSNRELQHGRQYMILVLRVREIGWTARTLEYIPGGAFVNSYAGEVVTAAENDIMEQTYAIEQNFLPMDKDKKKDHRPFVANGLNLGNETRFCPHSCTYNMQPKIHFVERDSSAIAHTGFHTIRPIKLGEELSWTYHADRLKKAKETGVKFKSDLIRECFCGSGKDCWIEKWDEADYAKAEEDEKIKKERKRVDSFADDDEQKENEEESVFPSLTSSRENISPHQK